MSVFGLKIDFGRVLKLAIVKQATVNEEIIVFLIRHFRSGKTWLLPENKDSDEEGTNCLGI